LTILIRGSSLKINLIALSKKVPSGGNIALYEFANALDALGNEVNLIHSGYNGRLEIDSIEDLSWFKFSSGVKHHIVEQFDEASIHIPDADAISGDWEGRPGRVGKPFILIQGKGNFGTAFELSCYLSKLLKVCVSRSLVQEGLKVGALPGEIKHVPLGLRHDIFRNIVPIEAREKTVAFCFNPHPVKRMKFVINVLGKVREHLPDVKVVAFGVDNGESVRMHGLPEWVNYIHNPTREFLVKEIYNKSSVFLCGSRWEGFGMPSLEAMACGASLVTTDNGGSREYAEHRKTAIVVPPGDREGLVNSVIELLTDDALRCEIGFAGLEMAKGFDWQESAKELAGVLRNYIGHI
jgi:glycosyltransferase involved in cell wall biosynthesis